ncbi:ATP-binding protein [Streptomyces sp. NPDC005004]
MPLLRQRRFPRARKSVGAARVFVTETLRDWGYDDRSDDIRLCVSELATNAVLHGVPPGREFALALTGDDTFIRVAVRDSGDGVPEVREGGAEECGGRGLRLVQELSDDFGVTTHNPGKTVWTVFKAVPTTRGAQPEPGAHG